MFFVEKERLITIDNIVSSNVRLCVTMILSTFTFFFGIIGIPKENMV
jgi:tetrahydromethanopterin S-methyltransferase subunit D